MGRNPQTICRSLNLKSGYKETDFQCVNAHPFKSQTWPIKYFSTFSTCVTDLIMFTTSKFKPIVNTMNWWVALSWESRQRHRKGVLGTLAGLANISWSKQGFLQKVHLHHGMFSVTVPGRLRRLSWMLLDFYVDVSPLMRGFLSCGNLRESLVSTLRRKKCYDDCFCLTVAQSNTFRTKIQELIKMKILVI